MMLGDKISASDAERMGMIYASFDEVDFVEKTQSDCGHTGKTANSRTYTNKKSFTGIFYK